MAVIPRRYIFNPLLFVHPRSDSTHMEGVLFCISACPVCEMSCEILCRNHFNGDLQPVSKRFLKASSADSTSQQCVRSNTQSWKYPICDVTNGTWGRGQTSLRLLATAASQMLVLLPAFCSIPKTRHQVL